MMTITRFVTMAWDWMDEGAPDPDPEVETWQAARNEPEPEAVIDWVNNFNWTGSRYHY